MGRILVAAAILVACAGCTYTRVSRRGDVLTFHRFSMLQKTQVPHLVLSTNGVIELTGYANDGGGKATAAILGAAFKAASKAAITAATSGAAGAVP